MGRLFRTYHFWIKILSGLCLVLFPLLNSFPSGSAAQMLRIVTMSEIGGISILMMLPQPDEDAKSGLFSALVILSVLLVCHFVRFPAGYGMAFALFMVFQRMVQCFRFRCSTARSVFRVQVVWYTLQGQVRLIYALLLSELALLSLLFSASWALAVLAVLLALMYVLPYLVSARGRILILSRKQESAVRQTLSRVRRDRPADRAEKRDEPAAMSALYEKVISIMESGRPFLKEDYSLNDLAFAAYTNKTYLSKTINVMSGKNFRQFINSYRVRYSIEVMKKNPRLRMDEVSAMSGFHSTVTFTMAFKANFGETPGEYAQRLKSNLV